MNAIEAGLGLLKTDITHKPGCPGNRARLYLVRTIEQAQKIEPDDDCRPIVDWGEWEFEQEIEPKKLHCADCDKWEYVAVDSHDNVIDLEPNACTRYAVHHITNWRTPCEYCGFQGDRND